MNVTRRRYTDVRDSAMDDFGTTQSNSRIRDNASRDGFGTTQNTLDLMKKVVNSFSGLRLATKITMTLVIYDCDV